MYNTTLAAKYGLSAYTALFATGTYGSKNPPFSFTMGTACDGNLKNSAGVVLATTSTKNHGATPCRFQIRQAALPMHDVAMVVGAHLIAPILSDEGRTRFDGCTSLCPVRRWEQGLV